MTRLTWNDAGKRFFEAGVDQGVFYQSNGNGVVWNGLTAVAETLTGGDPRPYYIDGVKYLNRSGSEEFSGTLSAYTYPDEFAEYDGTAELYDGLSVNLQPRKEFGLSYRTLIGNDLRGKNLGYKIHIIYNVLAAPTSKGFQSLGSNVNPVSFSWAFTTRPIKIPGAVNYSAHVAIDSTKVSVGLVRAVEEYLYGSKTRSAKLIPIDTLISWFELGGEPLEMVARPDGKGFDIVQDGTHNDLLTTNVEGAYSIPSGSRLTPSTPTGTYTLEA